MKVWRQRSVSAPPPAALASQLDLSPPFLELLWKRGFTTAKDINAYLDAPLAMLTNPAQWPCIPHAASLLVEGLLAGKKVAVWGDYDVDGITATALVMEILEEHGFEVEHHLPNRLKEGYGLNLETVEDLAARCDFLLTVDCGISNNEAVRKARDLGMTVIITDHHLPPPELPDAQAIVNPRIAMTGGWPCPYLSAVGVAFYFMAQVNALLAKHTGKKYKMDRALDLVALGTLADIVPMKGENRVLVHAGLNHISRGARPGMCALKDVSRLKQGERIDSKQILFRLAPRINAAGRMGTPDCALNLLRAGDRNNAAKLADVLDQWNTNRKEIENKIHEEAQKQAVELLARKNYHGLVLYSPSWHPGIIGIVASRIVEEFGRPAIILCDDKEIMKGSGRSVPGFDLHAGLARAAHCLLGFGGHKQAAGLSLRKDQLGPFRDVFSDLVEEAMRTGQPEPGLLLDGLVDFAQASDNAFLRELQMMEPFGPGNEEPLFESPWLVVQGIWFFGSKSEHVRLLLRDEENRIALKGRVMRGKVLFERSPEVRKGKKIKIAYVPRLESHNNNPVIDLEIRDWRSF